MPKRPAPPAAHRPPNRRSRGEGLDHAGHEGLSSFTAIVDVNRLGQRGPTELGWDVDAYAARVEAFGCDPIVIDGHDLAAIDEALARARSAERPQWKTYTEPLATRKAYGEALAALGTARAASWTP